MKFNNLKADKGVAGLTVFLSLIVMLFIIGLIVMIFALMGSELQSSSTVATAESGTAINETLATVTETGEDFVNSGLPAVACVVTAVQNSTDGTTIASGNYTQTNCNLAVSGVGYNNTNWNVSYTFTYGGASWLAMNDTVTGVSGATDWFPIFIVIGAMVVLILLTVIIIIAIRGSGLVATQGTTGTGRSNIGSA